MARNNKMHSITVQGEVVRLAHDGRGIVLHEGKTIFVQGALMGEQITFQITRQHSRYSEAKVITIDNPSKSRITPKCKHSDICGGCSLQHVHPEAQRHNKQQVVLEQLQHFGQTSPKKVLPFLAGHSEGYRRKARLGVKYVIKKDSVLVGFREKQGRYLAELSGCEVLHPDIARLIMPLRTLIQSLQVYQHIPQIEVAKADNALVLVFRHLEPLLEQDQKALIDFAKQFDLILYLQPKGPASLHQLWPKQAFDLTYDLPAYDITLHFKPLDFIQINAQMNQKLIASVLDLLALEAEDTVLDLFCGLGNFTLAMAKHCQEVVGIEGDLDLVKRAQYNAKINHIPNTQFYQSDLTQTDAEDTWSNKTFTKLLLDPPRTGALQIIRRLASVLPPHIVYVSCNPATLTRDACELVQSQGYTLTHIGIVDMFAHTAHVETIAVFSKAE